MLALIFFNSSAGLPLWSGMFTPVTLVYSPRAATKHDGEVPSRATILYT